MVSGVPGEYLDARPNRPNNYRDKADGDSAFLLGAPTHPEVVR